MQSVQVFSGGTEWSPLNVNTGSQAVKLLWLQGKDDISIMLSQHRGLGQVLWLLCPVPNPLIVFYFTSIVGRQLEKKTCWAVLVADDSIYVLYIGMNPRHIWTMNPLNLNVVATAKSEDIICNSGV